MYIGQAPLKKGTQNKTNDTHIVLLYTNLQGLVVLDLALSIVVFYNFESEIIANLFNHVSIHIPYTSLYNSLTIQYL